jgi:hypothetical protein
MVVNVGDQTLVAAGQRGRIAAPSPEDVKGLGATAR